MATEGVERSGAKREKNGGDEFVRDDENERIPQKKKKKTKNKKTTEGKKRKGYNIMDESGATGTTTRRSSSGGRRNSPSQVRPDSQNMTGTLSFSFSVSFPPTTLPACRDGTNRPKVMGSPPALGLGCRMRWYTPPSTRCVDRIVYSSVSLFASVVIFFLSSVLRIGVYVPSKIIVSVIGRYLHWALRKRNKYWENRRFLLT